MIFSAAARLSSSVQLDAIIRTCVKVSRHPRETQLTVTTQNQRFFKTRRDFVLSLYRLFGALGSTVLMFII